MEAKSHDASVCSVFRLLLVCLVLAAAVAFVTGCAQPTSSGTSADSDTSAVQVDTQSEDEPLEIEESAPSDAGLGPNEVRITKDDFGDDWPFTVDEGVLAGNGSGGIGEVIFTVDGVTYAVNGTARGTGKYTEIDEIWADDPELAGLKKNIGPIIDRGLELCQ